MSSRVTVDGKQFAVGGARFDFRGVTYGTFAPRADGASSPNATSIKRDFAAMSEAGFTVVRTYTAPPDDLVELARRLGPAAPGRRVLPGLAVPGRRVAPAARRRRASGPERSCAPQRGGSPAPSRCLGLVLGNEIPADVVRWLGTRTGRAATSRELADVVRGGGSATSSSPTPTTRRPSTCRSPTLDFLTFNVFLERRADFRRYLTRLHHLAGDRPLVLGEIGLHVGDRARDGERHRPRSLDWQLETAARTRRGRHVRLLVDRRVVGRWRSRSRAGTSGSPAPTASPRPALAVAQRWNRRTVADLDVDWPSISVVICAYNAAATLDECLRHTCALDYPDLEIIVVDDGSTDDTADDRRAGTRAPGSSTIEHGGLAVARNAGLQAAARRPRRLPRQRRVPDAGVAVLPRARPRRARRRRRRRPERAAARRPPRRPRGRARARRARCTCSFADDRAEHIPGCNMAFWKDVLVEVGGFDPIYTAAGDDVDVCWKVLDRGWEIGFHPAALVWHHRRPGLRAVPPPAARLRARRGARRGATSRPVHPRRDARGGAAASTARLVPSLGAPAGVPRRLRRRGVPVGVPSRQPRARRPPPGRGAGRGRRRLHRAAGAARARARHPGARVARSTCGVLVASTPSARLAAAAAGADDCASEARSRRCTCSSRWSDVGAGGDAGFAAAILRRHALGGPRRAGLSVRTR